MSFLMKEYVKYTTLVKNNNLNNLSYHFKSSVNTIISFIDFQCIFIMIYKITTGNQKHKLKDQLYAIRNIKNLYNSKDKLIKVYNNITKSIQL